MVQNELNEPTPPGFRARVVTVKLLMLDDERYRPQIDAGNEQLPTLVRPFNDMVKDRVATYLREIVEIPQHPEAEPDQGYYFVGVEVTDVA